MDFRELFLFHHADYMAPRIEAYMHGNADRFAELFKELYTPDKRLVVRVAWAVTGCLEKWPYLADGYEIEMLKLMKKHDLHRSVRRGMVRSYQFIPISEAVASDVYETCLGFFNDYNEEIAIRAFSLTVCRRVVQLYPELKNELKLNALEMLEKVEKGLKNRIEKELLKLEKI